MLPLHSGILAKAISIASSSLQQIQSISLALLLQCPHFRSNHPELFCKKVVFKNFARFIVVSADTGVSCEFYDILKNTFFSQSTSSGCFQHLHQSRFSILILYVINQQLTREYVQLLSIVEQKTEFLKNDHTFNNRF